MKLDLPPTFNMDSNRKEALKFVMREMSQYKHRKEGLKKKEKECDLRNGCVDYCCVF